MLISSNLTGFDVAVEELSVPIKPWLEWDGSNDGNNFTVSANNRNYRMVDMVVMSTTQALVVNVFISGTINVTLLGITGKTLNTHQQSSIKPVPAVIFRTLSLTKLSATLAIVTFNPTTTNKPFQVTIQLTSETSFALGAETLLNTINFFPNDGFTLETTAINSNVYIEMETTESSNLNFSLNTIQFSGTVNTGESTQVDSASGGLSYATISLSDRLIQVMGAATKNIFLAYNPVGTLFPARSGFVYVGAVSPDIPSSNVSKSSAGLAILNDKGRFMTAYSIPSSTVSNGGRVVAVYDEEVDTVNNIIFPGLVSSVDTNIPINEADGEYSMTKMVNDTVLVLAAQANGNAGAVTGRVYVDLGGSIQEGSIVTIEETYTAAAILTTATNVEAIDDDRALAVFTNTTGGVPESFILARVLQVNA